MIEYHEIVCIESIVAEKWIIRGHLVLKKLLLVAHLLFSKVLKGLVPIILATV